MDIDDNPKIDQTKKIKEKKFLWKFLENKRYKKTQIQTPMHQQTHQSSNQVNMHPTPCRKINKVRFKSYSLYNQLLLFGRISPESVKLNSTKKGFRDHQDDELFAPQRIEFMHTPPNTEISI
ncbi:hypothetical protein DMUE_4878 [Dictyocoela muelleri]|nr:hypothetical protein DMUE_4878 [Dictyocoela muelleri]